MRGGTHSSASPRRFALRASIVLPVSSRSSAAGAPTSRGSRLMPPHPGTMPSITSGSPRRVDGLVDDDAIAAGERELEAAAQAEAADQRERRIGHAREPLERVPAALHERQRDVGVA